jgi:serine/threonine-protein kinase
MLDPDDTATYLMPDPPRDAPSAETPPPSPAPAALDPLAGTGYTTRCRIAEGGMAEVFEVLAPDGSLAVAKLMHERFAGQPDMVDRMRVEAEALARIAHPNVVAVLGHGRTAQDRSFIVLERLRGRTLREELRARGPLPVVEAIDYTCQALDGLARAHAAGLVHRDVKLDNLFLCDAAAGRRVVKLLDLGVAKLLDGAAERAGFAPRAFLTREGVCVGTLRYLAPEQIVGPRVDQRADLYAAGMVLYILVAGRGPFDGARGPAAVVGAHLGCVPRPPSCVRPGAIPAELDAVVLRALAKDPAARWQSAAEMRVALAAVAAELAPAVRPATALPALPAPPAAANGRPLRRDLAFAALAIGTSALVTCSLAWLLFRLAG